ncbi:Mss4-like [Ceraceosorus bombacis]|uniref:Mss4-like n=1 Tax=Ceraceosorus bombacis TaxID=401625 RepID=A0A0P1BL00_9BASI|nr:Mss4-like [Ceraceosorus bombacis]
MASTDASRLDEAYDEDLTSAYCHCTRCQRFNAAPFVHTLHLPFAAVSWIPEAREDVRAPHLDSNTLQEAQEDRKNRGFPKARGSSWSEMLETYEAQEGRKWKLSWSIWPPTIQRAPSTTEAASNNNINSNNHNNTNNIPTSHFTGKQLASEKAWRLMRPDHHQFYGPWRSFDVQDDGRDKFIGYKGKSERVA